MTQVTTHDDGVLTYYNHGGETWGDVCDSVQDQSRTGFDYDYVFSHKGSTKPFAANHKIDHRWYKVREVLPAPVNDNGRLKYVLNNNNIDTKRYFNFYYVDENENYTIVQDLNDTFVCNIIRSKNFTEKTIILHRNVLSYPLLRV